MNQRTVLIHHSLCLAAPEAVAGRGVFDFKIVLFAEAGGLYVGNASGQQLVLMLPVMLPASNWC